MSVCEKSIPILHAVTAVKRGMTTESLMKDKRLCKPQDYNYFQFSSM